EADAAVVNSCAVTAQSEAKMRGLVRRIARRNPSIGTVVMGCAAALDDGAIAALPNVEGVVEGGEVGPVLRALGVDPNGSDPLLRRFERGARAWLKIQDGCDEHCTFCVTTVARGANRSRPAREIVEEAAALAASHEEIVLTGVHIGGYGKDLADPANPADLADLVVHLIRAVPTVRFRLSSIEATEVDDRLVALMVDRPDRLAPHLHAPLQSGSDPLLKRMGRHWYTAARYRERIEAIAARVPALGLGADLIVGFPGETDEDHRATVAMVEALPYTYLHVFPYSERRHAPARKLGGAVDSRVAARRAAELRTLADRRAAAYRARRDGGAVDVVLLGRRKGRWEGMTQDYLTVYLATEETPPGRFGATLRLADHGTMIAERRTRIAAWTAGPAAPGPSVPFAP
ncbi:MAG: MiaB/RimO family radical SAM methylthiotransferase, partial [Gemmatimonadales bacterium]